MTTNNSTDLRTWLSTEADLSGKKLQSTLDRLQAGEIEDLDDLRELVAMPKAWKEAFPAFITRGKIEEALSKETSPPGSTKPDTAIDEKFATKAAAKTRTNLPEGKRLSKRSASQRAGINDRVLSPAVAFEYACNWTTTKMETSVAAVKLSDVTADEQMVFHFTSLDAAKLIITNGFRMSPSGQGGGGVYFTKLSPAQYKYGQSTFKRLALVDCYGEEHLETYSTAPNFQVVLVCSVKTALLKPVPGGRDNAAMVPRTLMTAIGKPESDGYYYLQPKVVKRAYQLEDIDAGIFHAVTSSDLGVGEQLRLRVCSRYKSVEEAWIVFDVKKRNALSRSDFRRVVHSTLGIKCTDEQRKQIRHQLDPQNLKVVTFEAFANFINDMQQKQNKQETKHRHERSTALPVLPMEVPSLPDSFRPRLNVENSLKARLLDRKSKPCVTAQGMGGVGKSVVTSAVVRSKEIRERFTDGIAYYNRDRHEPDTASIGTPATMFRLQLTKEHLPAKRRSSVEEQHTCLSEALISKTCLIVLDDCWSKQHAKCFNVLDTTTCSKLLVSTRITGLLKNSSEVKLALMTNEEAVDLLAHGAGLDFEEVPHAVAEVVGLCGRLPLCLNIAASIIVDHGDNWQDEVLPEMRKGFSQLATGDEEDAKELTIQDSVIVASVASIVGKNAEKVKRLFINSAVFGEDQRVPCPLFLTLWAATMKVSVQAKNKNAVEHQIGIREAKKIVGVLVRRSLFLELQRGSVQLHDIVRDYVLARVEEERESTGGLQLLQRMFVSEFLASQEQWEDVGAGPTIPRGKEYDWYLSNDALQWHMQQAWTKPLVEDELACSWLFQMQEQIVTCAVKAIPSEAQVELAGDLAKADEVEKAVWILHNAIERRDLPVAEIQSNAKQLFSYVDSIPVSERSGEVTKYDATVAYKLHSRSNKASPDADFAFNRLIAALDQGASLGHMTTAQIACYKGVQLMGFFPSFSKPSKTEFYEGGQLLRRQANEYEAAILEGEISNPFEVYTRKWMNVLYPFHGFPADYWTEPLDTKENARVQVAELKKAAADYDYATIHPYKRVITTKQDVFLEVGNVLAILALRWCDERGVTDYLAKWEDGALRAFAEGEYTHWQYIYPIPVMRVIPALNCLWRVLEASAISWEKADEFEFNHNDYSWALPDGSVSCSHPEAIRMLAKINCFLCDRRQVETSEVLNYLPQADSCRWVRDRVNHTMSSTEPLEVLISQAALVCGDSSVCFDLAASHTKAAIPQHLMPQKMMHAQAALGIAMMRYDQARGSSEEISEETLAVLDVALESAKKMKLRKYAELIKEATSMIGEQAT